MMTALDRDLWQGVELMGGVRPRGYPSDAYAHATLPGYFTMPPAYHQWPGLFAREGFGSCATGFVVEALPLSGQYDITLRPMGFHRMSPCGWRTDYMVDPTLWASAKSYPFNMLAGY